MPYLRLLLDEHVATERVRNLVMVLRRREKRIDRNILLAGGSPCAVLVVKITVIGLRNFRFHGLLCRHLIGRRPLVSIPSQHLMFVLTSSLLRGLHRRRVQVTRRNEGTRRQDRRLNRRETTTITRGRIKLFPISSKAGLSRYLLKIWERIKDRRRHHPLGHLFRNSHRQATTHNGRSI